MKKRMNRRDFLRMAGGLAAGTALAACQPKTVIVEKEVEKEVTKIIKEVIEETVIVEGTPKIVEKEVTKVVKETVVVEKAVPQEPEAVTLRYWSIWGDPIRMGWLEEAIADFSGQNPEIEIEHTFVGGSGYEEKVNTAIAGGEPPDILDTSGSPRFGFRDMLIDMNPLLDASFVIRRKDFPEYQWTRVSWGDEIYGIPREADCNAIFWWNKDIFADAGLDPEKPPETWQDLKIAAEKTLKKDASGKIERIGFMPSYAQSWFYVYLWIAGAELWDTVPPGPDVVPKVLFNGEEGQEALTLMVELSDIVGGAEIMSSFEEGFQSGAQAPFWTGQLAMMCNGDWNFGDVAEYAPDLNFGITHMPVPPGGRIQTSSGGYAYSIPTGAQVKPAWKFVEYMGSAKVSLWRAKATRKLPANLNIANDPYFTEDPLLKVANDLVAKHGHGFPEAPWVGLMWNRVNMEMRDEALYHQKTVQQALDDAVKDVEDIIDQVYEYIKSL